jgi:hypothetical protein
MQNILEHDSTVQHSILSLLEASNAQQHSQGCGSSAVGHVSVASLVPLLRLLCSSDQGEVAERAEAVLQSWLQQLVGWDEGDAEVHLWLDMLPRGWGTPDEARYMQEPPC